MRLKEAHEGDHVMLGAIHERCELGEFGAQLVCNAVPLQDRRVLPSAGRCVGQEKSSHQRLGGLGDSHHFDETTGTEAVLEQDKQRLIANILR
jgi:hypothetical protein